MRWIKRKEGETQPQVLLRHLEVNKKQGITEKQAADEYGIRSFHRRLSDLKELGIEFETEWIAVPSRYGNKKAYVKRYTLKAS